MGTENVNIILAAQLEAVRNGAGITQAELAKRLEVTPQMVSYLEKAGSDTRLSVLTTWAAALGMEPALVPARRRTLIVDNDDSVVAFRQLHKHALITGPDRLAAARAVLELRAGARLHHGKGLDQFVAADSVALERLDARLFVDGDASGSVVVDLDTSDHDQVRQLLLEIGRIGWQRWAVVLIAETREEITSDIPREVAEHLHAENGNVFRCGPAQGSTEEALLLGRLADVLGMVLPANTGTDGVLLGEDRDGNPVFLELDELRMHSSVVGDRDLRRTIARGIVAGLLDAGWDATVVNLDDGRDDAESNNWMRVYAGHHDVRYRELTLRPTEVPARLDPYTGLDAEALTAVVLASQEFESPYYQAVAEHVVSQAVRLLHTAYHSGVREFPPTLAQIGKLLGSPDLPAAAMGLVERVRRAGGTLDDRDVDALLRPAKDVLESAAACGARLSRLAETRAARNVLVDTLGDGAALDLSARGVTYVGLDSWGQPELTDMIVESVIGQAVTTDSGNRHAGSMRRVILIEGDESARDESIVKLLGHARANGVIVVLSGTGSSTQRNLAGGTRSVSPEQHLRRLQNVNVRIAVGERREACLEALEAFGLTDEERHEFSQMHDGHAALIVTKPDERRASIRVRSRKPHERLR